jgi:hypothetical protein
MVVLEISLSSMHVGLDDEYGMDGWMDRWMVSG